MPKSIAKNRNAYRNFAIDDKYECGISLLGSEVKSIKANRLNINNSFVIFPYMYIYLQSQNQV